MAAGLAGFVACGGSSGTTPQISPNPHIDLDKYIFDWGVQTPGVYVGTTQQRSVIVTNNGEKNLVITGVSYAGAPQIFLNPGENGIYQNGQINNTLAPLASGAIALQCKPTGAETYDGGVTITSNAENTIGVVPAICVGVLPPDAGP